MTQGSHYSVLQQECRGIKWDIAQFHSEHNLILHNGCQSTFQSTFHLTLGSLLVRSTDQHPGETPFVLSSEAFPWGTWLAQGRECSPHVGHRAYLNTKTLSCFCGLCCTICLNPGCDSVGPTPSSAVSKLCDAGHGCDPVCVRSPLP